MAGPTITGEPTVVPTVAPTISAPGVGAVKHGLLSWKFLEFDDLSSEQNLHLVQGFLS